MSATLDEKSAAHLALVREHVTGECVILEVVIRGTHAGTIVQPYSGNSAFFTSRRPS